MSRKVLVVDDSGLARRRARGILESAGFEVIEAEDGIAAIEKADAFIRWFDREAPIHEAKMEQAFRELRKSAPRR